MMLISDGRIGSQSEKDNSLPFFRLAFRPFFWLGSLFSIISLLLWTLSFTGKIQFSPFGGGHFWHLHEMLFGFAAAIIVGFLLTAVQTWTKVPSIKGPVLAGLVVLWLTARILMALPVIAPDSLIAILDVLFLPLSALFLARPIVKARLWRNLIFVPILLLMGGVNGLMHLSQAGVVSLSYLHLSHVMVMMVSLVICIMGGRVFPMFTANGTKTSRVDAQPLLEKLSIISVVLSVLVIAELLPLNSNIGAAILLIAGFSNFARALRWKVWVTLKTPLVWPLHLSYWAISVGFILLALTKLGLLANASLGIHTITVGGMGLVILAMISRVSLGHTGRMIQVGQLVNSAFMLILLATVIRIGAFYFIDDYSVGLLASMGLWVTAYGIFVVKYAPILFKARVDGGPG